MGEQEAVEFEIRPIEPEEYEDAARLIAADLGEFDAFDYQADTSDLDPKRMEDLYEEPKGRFWVALADSQIVGTIALRRLDDRLCKLTRMSVHGDYKRSVLPQKLLEALEEYAREAGYRRVVAEATTLQKPAASFLESAGFKEFKRSLRGKIVVVSFEKAL